MPDRLKAGDRCLVWKENWEAVTLFLKCCTQWTAHGSLDYRVILDMGKLYEVEDMKAAMDGIQVIEAEIMTLRRQG